MAQQMYGGHGYIAEHGMEQFVRDARIAMLYEGANGIQALDLVGRKLPRDGGRAIMAFFGEVGAFAKEHGGDEAHEAVRDAALDRARPSAAGHHLADAERAGKARQCRRRRDRLHASVRPRRARLYVGADGQGGAGQDCGAAEPTPYLDTKLVTGRFFMERMLPETAAHLARIQSGSATTMELPAEAF